MSAELSLLDYIIESTILTIINATCPVIYNYYMANKWYIII